MRQILKSKSLVDPILFRYRQLRSPAGPASQAGRQVSLSSPGGVQTGGEGGLCSRGPASGEPGDQEPVPGQARHPVQVCHQDEATEEMCSRGC